MQVGDAASRVVQQNAEMMRVVQTAQQVNQDMANKMIRLSIEQQVAGNKSKLTSALVDMYL